MRARRLALKLCSAVPLLHGPRAHRDKKNNGFHACGADPPSFFLSRLRARPLGSVPTPPNFNASS